MSSEQHEMSFLKKYVFSTDHKIIGAQYFFVGLIMAAIGGYLAYVFRYNLAFPGETIPLFGSLAAAQYNAFVTQHGAIMIFWVAMPILVAASGNFLLPLMLGTDDMAFPVLNMLSFWVFLVSTLVLLLAFFVPSGPAASGWTLYPPLSADAYRNTSPNFFEALMTGGTLIILALALEFASMLMGGINFVVTTLNKRAKGMKLWDMPIFVWFLVLSVVDFMFSVGPIIAGAFMLLLDRTVGTGFFDAYRGGDPILFQHMFWFFGHPEVYVILFPSLGMIAEVISTFSRKALFGYKFMIRLSVVAVILSVVVWAHHQFVAGIDPTMATFFSVGTIIISIPFAGVILSFIATLWGGNIKLEVPMVWAMGFLALFLIGGLTGLYLGSNSFDIYAHDTYFVVAHFHYTLFPITFFGLFTGFYYWFPKFTGRMYNNVLGYIHFGLTFIFFSGIFIPLFFTGLLGQHRRINDYSAFDSLMNEPFTSARIFATICLIGLILSQFIFLYNFIVSAFAGKKAGRNPWKSPTLLWQTDSPPPHGNFKRFPTVYRDAYDYENAKEGEDYIPQNQQ